MSGETVSYELRDDVAHVTLNRADANNAMDPQLMKDLRAAADRCAAEARAAVLTGAGRSFSAGGDLRAFAATDDAPALLRAMTEDLHAAISVFARMDAPIVSAVNGIAAGAGLSLACACDLAIAGESTRFTMAYTGAGLSPDGSSTWFLPRLIGMRRTQELALTNRVLSAAEALDWQLVNKVVPDDTLLAEAEGLARALAAGPTGAYSAVKKLLLVSAENALEPQMALEGETIAQCSGRPDGQEGIRAFLEKRKPVFKGE